MQGLRFLRCLFSIYYPSALSWRAKGIRKQVAMLVMKWTINDRIPMDKHQTLLDLSRDETTEMESKRMGLNVSGCQTMAELSRDDMELCQPLPLSSIVRLSEQSHPNQTLRLPECLSAFAATWAKPMSARESIPGNTTSTILFQRILALNIELYRQFFPRGRSSENSSTFYSWFSCGSSTRQLLVLRWHERQYLNCCRTYCIYLYFLSK